MIGTESSIVLVIIFLSVIADSKRDKIMPKLYKDSSMPKKFLWWTWKTTQVSWHCWKWLSMFILWIYLSYRFFYLNGFGNIYSSFIFIPFMYMCRISWRYIYRK